MSKNKEYLGDSVYVQETDTGLLLTTENGRKDDPANKIFMEVETLQALLNWCQRGGYITNSKEGAS